MKWLHEHGIDADVIVGAKTKDLVILEKELSEVAGNLYVTTDDGSYGRSGMVNKSDRRPITKKEKQQITADAVSDDHDEILLPDNKETEHSDYCQHEPDHGGRYRYVRSLLLWRDRKFAQQTIRI